MSGTSLDGIDAALVAIYPRGQSYAVKLERFETYPFDDATREALIAVLPPHRGSVAEVARLHSDLGQAFGAAAKTVARGEPIGFVSSHGQTIWHDGNAHVTLQIGDAFRIREALNATVCYDFRSADTAAGGHGAPLIARVDALLLGDSTEDRVALNLGGIANVTLLAAGADREMAIAFDTGPGMMLIDAFVRTRLAGRAHFDRNGSFAAAGLIDPDVLAQLLADPYFSVPPPKTTGRERFGAPFLARHERLLAPLCLEDGAAVLTELTAASVAQAIERSGFAGARVIASGGGAHNSTLLARISARLAHARVETSQTMGFSVDAKEAIAFVVLAYELLRERAGNLPAATGAARAVPLGSVAPHALRALLAAIDTECKDQL